MHQFVGFVQGLGVQMEGISVLHQEFPGAHHAKPGATLVPEFGLNLVEVGWQLLVAADLIPDQVGNDLFVGRSETEITAMTVFHSQQFAAVLGPASGFLPEFGRLDRRHQHFLSATLVHFFANDSLDLAQGTQAHWQPGV